MRPRNVCTEPEDRNFAAAFAAALLDPAKERPAGARGPGGRGAARRYDVYRNNVTVSLIDALAAAYPAIQRLVGVEFFRAMARAHVRAEPPTSPLLFEYGRGFPAFIAAYEHVQDLPWLVDVARIERAWLDAYHAADAPPLAPEALVGVPLDRLADLVFIAHPATRVVRSAYPAVSIFAMNRKEGPIAPLCSGAAEDALITRPDMEVTVRHLPPGGAAFLIGLIGGASLGEAAPRALDEAPDFDLAVGLAGMIEAGVFASLFLG